MIEALDRLNKPDGSVLDKVVERKRGAAKRTGERADEAQVALDHRFPGRPVSVLDSPRQADLPGGGGGARAHRYAPAAGGGGVRGDASPCSGARRTNPAGGGEPESSRHRSSNLMVC